MACDTQDTPREGTGEAVVACDTQDTPREGTGEAVVACDTPEPCKFPSFDSCQKRFPWAHTEVDLVPHSVDRGQVMDSWRTVK